MLIQSLASLLGAQNDGHMWANCNGDSMGKCMVVCSCQNRDSANGKENVGRVRGDVEEEEL